MKDALKIGIIGLGSIGREIALYIEKLKFGATVAAVCDCDEALAASAVALLRKKPQITDIEGVFRLSGLVVESAGQAVLPVLLKLAAKYRKPLLVMSVGGLIVHRKLAAEAEKKGVSIYAPSGAIAGLDAVKAAAIAGIKQATLTTRKPPYGLKGAPYLLKNNIDTDKITKETTVFCGSVMDALRGFPANINVSAALALASGDIKKVKVKIIADPKVKNNTHEIFVEGDFGVITTRTSNRPFPQNPKTSYLAALSAVALIKKLAVKGLSAGS